MLIVTPQGHKGISKRLSSVQLCLSVDAPSKIYLINTSRVTDWEILSLRSTQTEPDQESLSKLLEGFPQHT